MEETVVSLLILQMINFVVDSVVQHVIAKIQLHARINLPLNMMVVVLMEKIVIMQIVQEI